ncbi:MAG: hypothetical protein WCX31_06610 [Salinivirgaceae bacterium]|jgi:hypothetical protein
MKNILFSFLLLILLYSCEDNNDSIHLSKQLKLSISSTENDIKLNWSLLQVESFTQYSVQWSIDKNYWTSLISINDYQTTEYTCPKFGQYMTVYFRVRVQYNEYQTSTSNIVELNNPDIFNFSVTPTFACWWPEEDIIYVANYSSIEKVNYVSKKSLLIQSINQGINNIYLLDYKGVKELYILSGNRLLIYNPIDLTKKDEIVLDNSIFVLTSDDNGHLIVSDYYQITIYDRGTKQKVSSLYTGQNVKLLFLSSKNQILASDNYYMYRYSLSTNGQISLIDNTYYNYSNELILKTNIAESYVVRGVQGNLFDDNMNQIGTIYNIANYNECNDYTFSNNSIYCSSDESNTIYQFQLPDLTKINEISLFGVPTFIEYDSNTLYVVIKNSYDNWGNYVYSLEKITDSK